MVPSLLPIEQIHDSPGLQLLGFDVSMQFTTQPPSPDTSLAETHKLTVWSLGHWGPGSQDQTKSKKKFENDLFARVFG